MSTQSVPAIIRMRLISRHCAANMVFTMIAEADLESHGVGTLYTNDGHDCMGYIAQDDAWRSRSSTVRREM